MRRLRRRRLLMAVLAAAFVLASTISACGSSSGNSSNSGGSSAPTTTSTADRGKMIFTTAGCAGCHTLAAAGASGSVGPDLDTLKPSYSAVVKQVTNGGGVMPSFAKSLSKSQIEAVAHFVATSAKGG